MHAWWRWRRRWQLCHRASYTCSDTLTNWCMCIVFNRSTIVGDYPPDIRNGYRQELLCAANKNDNPFEQRDHDSSACTNIYVCGSFRLPLICDFTHRVVRALDDCPSDVSCQRKNVSVGVPYVGNRKRTETWQMNYKKRRRRRGRIKKKTCLR